MKMHHGLKCILIGYIILLLISSLIGMIAYISCKNPMLLAYFGMSCLAIVGIFISTQLAFGLGDKLIEVFEEWSIDIKQSKWFNKHFPRKPKIWD